MNSFARFILLKIEMMNQSMLIQIHILVWRSCILLWRSKWSNHWNLGWWSFQLQWSIEKERIKNIHFIAAYRDQKQNKYLGMWNLSGETGRFNDNLVLRKDGANKIANTNRIIQSTLNSLIKRSSFLLGGEFFDSTTELKAPSSFHRSLSDLIGLFGVL